MRSTSLGFYKELSGVIVNTNLCVYPNIEFSSEHYCLSELDTCALYRHTQYI